MTDIYNLDENIKEYFDFMVKGHTYRFRQLNTKDMKELQKIDTKDETALLAFLSKFIEPLDGAPDFSVIQEQMVTGHWLKFKEMITSEFSGQ